MKASVGDMLLEAEGERVEAVDFVSEAMRHQGDLMARYSIGATPVPDWREIDSDAEIAEALAEVKVDDPNFGEVRVKDASEEEWFDAGSLTVAKAVALGQEAPPEKKSLWRGFADKIAKEVGGVIATKAGKKGLAMTAGLALVATACGEATQPVQPTFTPEAVRPTATEVAPTPTVEPTETQVPTPTPEVFEGNPGDIQSWPENYQDYFANPGEAEITDAQFDRFLNGIRRNYLQERGIQGAEDMNPEQLLQAMIEESAREQRELILSPTEIRAIASRGNINANFASWGYVGSRWETGTSLRYGIWDDGVVNQPIDYGLDAFVNYTYRVPVFGQQVEVHGYPSMYNWGDLVGIVRLPQGSGYGALIRMLDRDLNPALLIYQIPMEPIQFSPDIVGDFCHGASPKYQPVACPEYTFPRFQAAEWGAANFRPMEIEELRGFLQWPPPRVRLWADALVDPRQLGQDVIRGFVNPETGLELNSQMLIVDIAYRNAPEMVVGATPTTSP